MAFFSPVQASNGYSYQLSQAPNGQYSYNYFGPGNAPVNAAQYTQGSGNQLPSLSFAQQKNNEYISAGGIPVTDIGQKGAKTYSNVYDGVKAYSPNVLALGNGLPTNLLDATPQNTGGTAPTFKPTYFNGVLYNDPESLASAQQQYYQQNYNNQYQLLQDAYGAGNIGFQSRQLGIDQNRQNLLQQYNPETQNGQLIDQYNNNLASLLQAKNQALGSQSAFASYVSPNATQSAFGDMQNNTVNEYNRQQGNLDTNKANNIQAVQQALAGVGLNQQQLGADQTQFNDQYNTNVQGLQQSLQNQNDSANQGVLDFRNRVNDYYTKGAGSVSANTQQVDPVALLSQLQQYQIQANQFGYSPEQTRGLISAQLGQLGLNNKDQSAILQALYAQPGNQKNGKNQ